MERSIMQLPQYDAWVSTVLTCLKQGKKRARRRKKSTLAPLQFIWARRSSRSLDRVVSLYRSGNLKNWKWHLKVLRAIRMRAKHIVRQPKRATHVFHVQYVSDMFISCEITWSTRYVCEVLRHFYYCCFTEIIKKLGVVKLRGSDA